MSVLTLFLLTLAKKKPTLSITRLAAAEVSGN